MNKYVLVQWPESQQLIDFAIKEGWEDECILAQGDENQPWIGGSAYFIPENRIETDNEAVEFGEWISDSSWKFHKLHSCWINNDYSRKTSEELYKIFKNEQ